MQRLKHGVTQNGCESKGDLKERPHNEKPIVSVAAKLRSFPGLHPRMLPRVPLLRTRPRLHRCLVLRRHLRNVCHPRNQPKSRMLPRLPLRTRPRPRLHRCLALRRHLRNICRPRNQRYLPHHCQQHIPTLKHRHMWEFTSTTSPIHLHLLSCKFALHVLR